jgi:glycosyltransferase involved in cell wall biosynthesis
MLEGAQILVIVPALNEAPRIGRVIRGLPVLVDHIIVVDDASTDGTGDAALAVGDPRVTVVRHEENRGVGAAIVSGYKVALRVPGGPDDAFVVMAGDAQMDPSDLPRVAQPVLRGHVGYVKGERFGHPEVRARMPRARFFGGRVLSWMTSRAIGLEVTDSQCGYTAMARWACRELALDDVWPRYGYPNDLLAHVVRAGIPLAEVPVRPIYADEVSGLRARHVPLIVGVVVRSYMRRRLARRVASAGARGGSAGP